MTHHVLDRAVWNALTGPQAELAEGGDLARRFNRDQSPFAAARDGSPESLAALAALIVDETWLVEIDPVAPPGTKVLWQASCTQMTAPSPGDPGSTADVVSLTDADAPEMRALAALTQPGPFLTDTHRLSVFLGIKAQGRLIAMAGERLRPPGNAEVSGVCTHPDYRGRGYAGMLMRQVVARIAARGETPYLTAYTDNTRAIALYETLGFVTRRTLTAMVLVPGQRSDRGEDAVLVHHVQQSVGDREIGSA